MTYSAQEKYNQAIKQFQKSTEISDKDKKWLEEKFLPFLERRASNSPHTKEKYVKWLRTILENNPEIHAHKISDYKEKNLLDLTEQVVNQIQSSEYKQKPGDYSKRTKDDIWYTWKRLLESHGLRSSESAEHIPFGISFSSQKTEVDKHGDTRPEDLPTPKQMPEFLRSLETVSKAGIHGLRNTSFVLILWDTGTRWGEAINLKVGDITVKRNGQVYIEIEGNKDSEDRKIRMFQGTEVLKNYIQQHPYRDNPDAALFPRIEGEDKGSIGRSTLRKKFKQARDQADLDFKLRGEPFHIFRKAMTTFYKVNEILSWEKICKRQGKKPDATKPDYLKVAQTDVDSAAAEGFGLEESEKELDHSMIGNPLTPVNCTNPDCGKKNMCYREVCQYCGSELPESKMPKAEEEKEDVVDLNLSAEIGARMARNPDKTLNEIKKEVLKQHGN